MRSCQNIGNLKSSYRADAFFGTAYNYYDIFCYDCYAGGHVFADDWEISSNYNGRGNYSNGSILKARFNTYISSSSLSISDFDADTKKFTNTSISNNPYLKNVDTPILLNISTGIYKVNDKFKIMAYDISGSVLTDIKWSTIYGRCIVDLDGNVAVKDWGLETIIATDSQGNKANCNIYACVPSTSFVAKDRTNHVNTSSSYDSYDNGYFTKSGGNGDYIIDYKCDNSSVLGLGARMDDGTFQIHPRAAGTATITATTISGLTATQTVTVTNYLTSLSLPSSATVPRGTSKKLALTTTPSPTSSKITWTSSDTSVATVDQDGRVEGIKKGTSIITAKSDNGYSATCTVNVTAPVTSMEFEQPSVTLYKGDVQNLNLICTPLDTTDSVTYSVSNSSVLSVEKDGTATANTVGQCRVTATSSSGVKAYCVVTVIEVPVIVAGISLDQTEASMKVGEVLRLISTITPSDATDKTVTWASTDETVATVSSGGTVEAKGSGKAIITATTQNGIIASCEINVAGVASTNLSRIYIPEILSTREEFIKIPVMIEHNPGISFASLNAIYDSDVLEPVEVTNGDVFESVLGSIDRDNRRIKLVFTSEENISIDGTLAFIKFKVLDSEKQSTLKVCYYPNTIRNIQSKSVSFNLADGIIKETKCKHKNTYLKNKLDATCSSTGYTGDVYCSDCAALIESGKVIDKLQHTVAVDAAVAATCTKKGKTAGSHCSVCGAVIKAQKAVSALGHKYKTTTKKATTSKDGKTVTACTVCGKVKKTTVIYKASSVKLSKTSYTYNGKTQKPKVVVKNSKGKALTEGKDYTVKYPKGMKNPGSYTVTITFKGNYSGKKTLTSTIAPKAPTLKVTAAKKSAKLSWNKQTGATGYNVYMATSKNGKYKKFATVKGNKVSYTKTGLTKGKTYYFKVAAYTTSGGKAISGAYSAVKSVKVK